MKYKWTNEEIKCFNKPIPKVDKVNKWVWSRKDQ